MSADVIRIDLNGVNCYLVTGRNGCILFDTGGHLVLDRQFTNRYAALRQALEKAGCTEDNLNLIVLTHGDGDHVYYAADLRAHYGAKIAMHADDRELVEQPTLANSMASFRFRSLPFRVVTRLMRKAIMAGAQKTLDGFKAFSPDLLLPDGFDLSPYGLDATVIHIPGHTEGSIAVLTKNGDLIAGDSLTNGKKPGLAQNAANFERLGASVTKLKNYTIKTVYPGHGEPFAWDARIISQ